MRVLHVQKVKTVGGAERHLLSLLPALVAEGVEVRMVAAASGRVAGTVIDALRERGVDTAVLAAGPDVNPLLVARLRREIRRFRPDVVHTHLIHADLHGQVAARMAGVPGIASVHNAMGFYRREPTRTVTRFAGRLARRTIAISEHVRRMIEQTRLARSETIRVIPYGIDATEWTMTGPEREDARVSLGIDSEDVVAGVASRLIPDKGHAVLIEAMGIVRARVPKLSLLIGGDGPLKSELERQAGGDPHIRFLGHVNDIRTFMNACDVVVMPTLPKLSEGFGLAALEAMAAGRPVVATEVGSLPEVVRHGETGLLVQPGSPEALALALGDLGSNPPLREAMGHRGRGDASTIFSIDRMVERTLEVYREVV